MYIMYAFSLYCVIGIATAIVHLQMMKNTKKSPKSENLINLLPAQRRKGRKAIKFVHLKPGRIFQSTFTFIWTRLHRYTGSYLHKYFCHFYCSLVEAFLLFIQYIRLQYKGLYISMNDKSKHWQ